VVRTANSRQAVLQLSDKGLELVKVNTIHVPFNVAYDRAVAYVEGGHGNWRTNKRKDTRP
jgi:hypothetical protein